MFKYEFQVRDKDFRFCCKVLVSARDQRGFKKGLSGSTELHQFIHRASTILTEIRDRESCLEFQAKRLHAVAF